ncbi:MAG: DUF2807 domain-containing protein [Bacteroidales bacterium]|nr:DUF2807 domain-containing protein [Bacteroidales bacterium]
MKRLLLTLAAAAIALFTANAGEKTKTYNFDDITAIDANFLYSIHVTEGRSDKVTVVYDDMLETFLDLEVDYKDGTLRLSRKVRDKKSEKKFGRWVSGVDRERVDVYLEMDTIKSIRISGAANITFEGTFKADDLDIDISGASALKALQVNGKSMDVDCSGASRLSVSGNFSKEVGIELTGASRMTYTGDSETLEADMSGASSFTCEGKYSTADINCSGASKAELTGKVGNAEYEGSGASNIDAQDFIAKTVSVELSGASKAKIHASDDIYYNVARASTVTYYGDAKLHNRSVDTNIIRGR